MNGVFVILIGLIFFAGAVIVGVVLWMTRIWADPLQVRQVRRRHPSWKIPPEDGMG